MSQYIPVALKRRIKAQFSACCAYCQSAEHLTVAIFEVEHIIPQVVGGETVLDNAGIKRSRMNDELLPGR